MNHESFSFINVIVLSCETLKVRLHQYGLMQPVFCPFFYYFVPFNILILRWLYNTHGNVM